MKLSLKIAIGIAVSLLALFLIAGRSVSELTGLLQASAHESVDGLVEGLPDSVRDRKLAQDLDRLRQSTIDSKVQLKLAQADTKALSREVEALRTAIAAREDLLMSADGVLQKAEIEGAERVTFGGQDFTVAEFRGDINDLLNRDERDRLTLSSKENSLSEMRRTVRDGAESVRQMEVALAHHDSEIKRLQSERDLANMMRDTIHRIEAINGGLGQNASSSFAAARHALEKQVAKQKADNEARRESMRSGGGTTNRLQGVADTRERMKALRDRRARAEAGASEPQEERVAPKGSQPEAGGQH